MTPAVYLEEVPMTDTIADGLAVRLTELKQHHQDVVDRVNAHRWADADDAWDFAGPMAVTEYRAGETSRQFLRLIAFAERVLPAADAAEDRAARTVHDDAYERGQADALRMMARLVREALAEALGVEVGTDA